MIEYIANFYEGEKRPSICKKFTSSTNEESHTVINVGNESEISEISAETVYQHMDNVLRYLDIKMDSMSLVQLNEFNSGEAWPIKGWSEVEWCQNEIILWWNYIYYKDYDERVQAYIDAQYEAEQQRLEEEGWVPAEHAGHTHDPETGEEIPTPPEEGAQP
jgi:hypothetical protein